MAPRRKDVLQAAALGILLVGGIAMVSRSVVQRGRQVRNVSDMRAYREAVEEYAQNRGHLPLTLEEAVREWPKKKWGTLLRGQDNWGHFVVYLPSGTEYLLVSFGRDGKPDGTQYAQLRAANAEDEAACNDLDADVVMSDRGEHRSCHK